MRRSFPKSDRTQPCDLCEGSDFRRVADRDRDGRSLGTCVCEQCGLVAHERIPEARDLAAYYAREYRRDYHGEFVPSPRRVLREWQRGRRMVRRLRPHLPPGARVFEIGAGMGCTVKNLELAGYQAGGIEPGEGFLQFANQHLHARIEAGELADVRAEGEFDAVLLIHVLEHLRSPREALARMRRMLRPDGLLVIEVPNVAAPHASPGKLFHFAHIYNFTPRTLEALANVTGFAVRQWLSKPEDKAMVALLELAEIPTTEIARSEIPIPLRFDPTSYDQAVAALTRFTPASYVLRWSYLRERLARMLQQQAERILARHRVARILRRLT